jgi:IS30 family transposase
MIELRLQAHVGVRQIGRDLKRNHGVVSREIERNRSRDGTYSAVLAQEKADRRKAKQRKKKRKLDADDALREHVISELRSGRSPDVIAGRLKTDPPGHLQGKAISHEAIYQWIQIGEGRKLGLHHLLLSGRPRRQQRHGRKKRKTHIPGRISIHERPEGINGRKEVGHWETDSMVFSKQRERLSVQYERKARYVMIHRLPDGTAEATEEALHDSIQSLPQDLWKSLTFDNGGEGANHTAIRSGYGIRTFFCDPYASWQKGGVENTNGIIRRFLPRDTDMSQVTQRDIYVIQERINDTPRKILGYKTPKEVLASLCGYRVVHC